MPGTNHQNRSVVFGGTFQDDNLTLDSRADDIPHTVHTVTVTLVVEHMILREHELSIA
jgi:hypothetical protein